MLTGQNDADASLALELPTHGDAAGVEKERLRQQLSKQQPSAGTASGLFPAPAAAAAPGDSSSSPDSNSSTSSTVAAAPARRASVNSRPSRPPVSGTSRRRFSTSAEGDEVAALTASLRNGDRGAAAPTSTSTGGASAATAAASASSGSSSRAPLARNASPSPSAKMRGSATEKFRWLFVLRELLRAYPDNQAVHFSDDLQYLIVMRSKVCQFLQDKGWPFSRTYDTFSKNLKRHGMVRSKNKLPQLPKDATLWHRYDDQPFTANWWELLASYDWKTHRRWKNGQQQADGSSAAAPRTQTVQAAASATAPATGRSAPLSAPVPRRAARRSSTSSSSAAAAKFEDETTLVMTETSTNNVSVSSETSSGGPIGSPPFLHSRSRSMSASSPLMHSRRESLSSPFKRMLDFRSSPISSIDSDDDNDGAYGDDDDDAELNYIAIKSNGSNRRRRTSTADMEDVFEFLDSVNAIHRTGSPAAAASAPLSSSAPAWRTPRSPLMPPATAADALAGSPGESSILFSRKSFASGHRASASGLLDAPPATGMTAAAAVATSAGIAEATFRPAVGELNRLPVMPIEPPAPPKVVRVIPDTAAVGVAVDVAILVERPPTAAATAQAARVRFGAHVQNVTSCPSDGLIIVSATASSTGALPVQVAYGSSGKWCDSSVTFTWTSVADAIDKLRAAAEPTATKMEVA